MNLATLYKSQFEKTLEHLRMEISGLRTGRAAPAIVENIQIEAYGTRQQLKGLASISVIDAKTIGVSPWDKSILSAIDTSIRNSNLGLNPVNDGVLIRLVLPELTQDRRQELIKVLHSKLEEARIAVRKIREEARDHVDRSEESREMGEDERFTQYDNIEKMVKDYNEKIKEMGEGKEEEITTI